jgi:hypothetical protein
MRLSLYHLLIQSFIAAASLMFTLSAYAAIGDYSSIETPSNTCLRSFHDSNKVVIAKCDATANANDSASMRMWKLTKQSGNFYTIQNQYKSNAKTQACLRTFSGNNNIEIDHCSAKGTATDLTSMRLWKLVEVAQGSAYLGHTYYTLENKYKGDIAGNTQKCLKILPINSNVNIAPCAGTIADPVSYRQWKSKSGFIHNTHPYGKSWQPTHIAHVIYTLPNQPTDGFDSIKIPVKIVKSQETAGFFYATSFSFINGNRAYIGIQPRGKDKGMAAFSVFGSGVVRKASHCSGNADGRDGSSCSKTIELKFGRTYNLIVKRDAKDRKLWRGYVEDPVAKKTVEIGNWEPRAGSKGIYAADRSFVEYYGQINSCAKIPYSESIHYHPVATAGNKTVNGKFKKPYLAEPGAYGRCVKHMTLNSENKTDNAVIKVQGKAE